MSGSISINNVSKFFFRNTKKKSYTSLKSLFLTSPLSKSTKELAKSSNEEIKASSVTKALEEISIEINPGETTALIGGNGSGKSTLLKLISGIYKPDSGTIEVKGRVSSLIELGTGFHPDFTGKENIFLGGAMFGMNKKEIDKIYQQIVDFSELEDVIDDPVRTYSSGMYMRLGFSLAVHTDPDILLIDEILSVGDARFNSRCEEKIASFKRQGKTIVVVTHDMSAVTKWCDRAIWMQNGKVKVDGQPQRVVDLYLEESLSALDQIPAVDETKELLRWGDKSIEIEQVEIYGEQSLPRQSFKKGESVNIKFNIKKNLPVENYVVGIGLLTLTGNVVFGCNSDILKHELKSESSFKFSIKNLLLTTGTYFIDLAVHHKNGAPYDYHHMMYRINFTEDLHIQGVYAPEIELTGE